MATSSAAASPSQRRSGPLFQIPSSQLPPAVASPRSEESAQAQENRDNRRGHVIPLRTPVLRFEVRDLSDKAAQAFLTVVNAGTALEASVAHVLDLLYTPKIVNLIPPTRSVTLVLRDMDGVAYTTGTDLDSDHKEIHLSTRYLAQTDPSRLAHEIQGVLVHEMVHCWQWAANGTAPSGLIEGIADWVRLRANFAPPHWKPAWKDCNWDAGYDRTAYFLDWLEAQFGHGTVRGINLALRNVDYEEEDFWHSCCSQSISELWKQYGKAMDKKEKQQETSARSASPLPTCR